MVCKISEVAENNSEGCQNKEILSWRSGNPQTSNKNEQKPTSMSYQLLNSNYFVLVAIVVKQYPEIARKLALLGGQNYKILNI